MASKKSEGPVKSKAMTGNGAGKGVQRGLPAKGEPGRGSSIQGERQDAKGGPMGANQGGASRGGSRVEPSHTARKARQDGAKMKGKKG